MKKKILIILAIALLAYLLNGYYKGYKMAMQVRAEHALKSSISPLEAMSVPELIDYASNQTGANKTLLKTITYCESNHRTDVSHDGGAGWGVTGYQKATFEVDKKRFNRPDLIYESTYDQLYLMALAFNHSEALRDRWTTHVAYQNGGTYTFIDRKGVKHTARCNPTIAYNFK